jgi:hypothetical protein
MLPQALLVMAAWGFDYRSHMVWCKDRSGTGYWFRNQHELLLVGVKGNIPTPAMGTQAPSVQDIPRSEHSAKPEKFLQIIEDYFPTLPKIELNRRGPARPGWSAWGNEAEQTTERAAVHAAPSGSAAPEPAPPLSAHGARSSPSVADQTKHATTDLPNDDGLDIPNFLRIGHPQCTWRRQEMEPE